MLVIYVYTYIYIHTSDLLKQFHGSGRSATAFASLELGNSEIKESQPCFIQERQIFCNR